MGIYEGKVRTKKLKMARNFSNTSKTEDLEWKKLRHFKGDRSSFYVKHDTFISPSTSLTITRSWKRNNDAKDKDEAAEKLHESMRQLLDGEGPGKRVVINEKEKTPESKFKRRNSKKVSPKKIKDVKTNEDDKKKTSMPKKKILSQKKKKKKKKKS